MASGVSDLGEVLRLTGNDERWNDLGDVSDKRTDQRPRTLPQNLVRLERPQDQTVLSPYCQLACTGGRRNRIVGQGRSHLSRFDPEEHCPGNFQERSDTHHTLSSRVQRQDDCLLLNLGSCKWLVPRCVDCAGYMSRTLTRIHFATNKFV